MAWQPSSNLLYDKSLYHDTPKSAPKTLGNADIAGGAVTSAKIANATLNPPTGPTGFWGRIGQIGIGQVNLLNAARLTRDTAVSTERSVKTGATGIARVLPGGTNDLKAELRQSEQASQQTSDAAKLFKSGKINKSQYAKLTGLAAKNADEAQRGTAKTIKAMPSKRQVLGGLATTALLAVPGAGQIIKLTGTQLLKVVGTQGIKDIAERTGINIAGKASIESANAVARTKIAQQAFKKASTSFGERAAKTGLKTGAGFGAFSAAQTAAEGGSNKEILKSGVEGFIGGAAAGVTGSLVKTAVKAKFGKPSAIKTGTATRQPVTSSVGGLGKKAIAEDKRTITEAKVAKSMAAPKTKLLAAPTGKAEGKGFTMSPITDVGKLKMEARLGAINAKLTAVSQGKIKVSPGEFRTLQVEKTAIYKQNGRSSEATQLFSDSTADLNFQQATDKLATPEHREFARQASDINTRYGAKTIESRDLIGDTTSYGTENSVAQHIQADAKTSKLIAAEKGLAGKQLTVLNFDHDALGPDFLARITMPKNLTKPELRSILDKRGLEFRSIDPKTNELTIYSKDAKHADALYQLKKDYNGTISIQKGTGEFIGSDTSREEAANVYRGIIKDAGGSRRDAAGYGNADNRSSAPAQKQTAKEKLTGEASNIHNQYQRENGRADSSGANGRPSEVRTGEGQGQAGQKSQATNKLKLTKSAGKTAPSQLSAKVNARAVEHGLSQDLGDIREHAVMDIKEQSRRAVDLINTDTQKAIDVALGKRAAPSGTNPLAIFNAVETKAMAEGDGELMRRLANSKLMDTATAGGQTLRILKERNSSSPIALMQQLLAARAAAAEKRIGSVTEAVNKTIKDIETHSKPPSKFEWQAFVEGIKC